METYIEVLDIVRDAVMVALMLLVKGRREVEENPADQGEAVDTKEKPIAISPTGNAVVLDEGSRDDRTNTRSRICECIEAGAHHVAVLHRHQLTHDEVEA